MCYVNYTSKTFMMQNRVYLKNGGWWRRHRCRQVQRGIVCIFVYAAWASAGQAAQTLCLNASGCRTRFYESSQPTVHRADDEKPYCFCVPVQLFRLPSSHAEEKTGQRAPWQTQSERSQPVCRKIRKREHRKRQCSMLRMSREQQYSMLPFVTAATG